MVCLSFDEGYFLRINSEDKFRPCVAITRAVNPSIVEHDSFVECALLMIDEYEVETALVNAGILGTLDLRYKNEILDKLLSSRTTRQSDKDLLSQIFADAPEPN